MFLGLERAFSARIKKNQSKETDIDLHGIIKKEKKKLEENMSRQYEKEFKENAVQYHHDHPELTIKECAEKLGVPYDTYHGWLNSYKYKGENAFRGSGNYSSDEAKEIARLKRELRDTQDALEILKKAIGILGK